MVVAALAAKVGEVIVWHALILTNWQPKRFPARGGGCYIIPDIFAIEACGSVANLFDKRSRFAPSTSSLMAVCPLPWLLAAAAPNGPEPRWVRTKVFAGAPTASAVLPVRDLRVLYALKLPHYLGFANSQVPHAHELFVPMHALVAEGSDRDPAMQALCARASARSNFLAVA